MAALIIIASSLVGWVLMAALLISGFSISTAVLAFLATSLGCFAFVLGILTMREEASAAPQ